MKTDEILWIAKMIRKAINEKKSRIYHGNASYNAFYITSNEQIIPFNKLIKIIHNPENLITVHSHSSLSDMITHEKNFDKSEDFQTFSHGDIRHLQFMVKKGWGNIEVLIASDGQMELIEVPKNIAQIKLGKFLKLSLVKLEKELTPLSYYNKGYIIEDFRIKVGEFAQKYGLIHLKDLKWKSYKKQKRLNEFC